MWCNTDLPWHNNWFTDNLLGVLNEHLSLRWLDVMYQPKSYVCTTRINLGLMLWTACMFCSPSWWLMFDGLVIDLDLIGISVSAARWRIMRSTWRWGVSFAQEAEMFWWTHCPLARKWWLPPMAAVFGSSSSLHPLVSGGGGMLCSAHVRLIFCQIFVTASSSRSLCIGRSFAIRLIVLPPLPAGRC